MPLDEFEIEQIKKWCDFHEGKLTEEETKSNFAWLFTRNKSMSNYKKIFQYFPDSDDLVARTMNVINHWENKKPLLTDQEIIDIVRNEADEMRKICLLAQDRSMANILATAKNNVVVLRSDERFFAEGNDCLSEFIETINDFRNYNGESAFYDNFYHLCCSNFRLTWYLCGPMELIDASFENYFKLWSMGADYTLMEDRIVVIGNVRH